MHALYAALTPLTATPAVHAGLSGVSLPVTLRVAGTKASASGGFLFTHRGYSGPAVLDVSHHAVRAAAAGRPQPILAQWSAADDAAWHATLQGGDGLVVSRLRATLPERLAQQLVVEAGLAVDQRIATLRREHRLALVERLCRYPLPWTGDEGFRKAEVTGGGVALDEVDPRTHGVPPAPRAVPVRRAARRLRPDRRPQLRVGVGDRPTRRPRNPAGHAHVFRSRRRSDG